MGLHKQSPPAWAKWVCKINCVIASDSVSGASLKEIAIPECCDCFVSLRSTRNDEYPINFAQVLNEKPPCVSYTNKAHLRRLTKSPPFLRGVGGISTIGMLILLLRLRKCHRHTSSYKKVNTAFGNHNILKTYKIIIAFA